MAQEIKVDVDLANQKVRFTGAARTNPPVTFDYDPPLGDGQGYTGLEGLLMSLAACSATAIVALLRQMRKSVAGFRVEASGTRRETHPTCFDKISLKFIVTSADAGAEDVEKAIRLSEESICPVWAMLKGNVEIRSAFEIRKP
jgi:putative redox protein